MCIRDRLYEELLIRTEALDKTDNSLIFVERDKPREEEVIEHKLDVLREALSMNDNAAVKAALKRAVKTFHDHEEVNRSAVKNAIEMKLADAERKADRRGVVERKHVQERTQAV